MNTQQTEEVNETVRGILSQVTVYIDDVAIHMGSNRPTDMTDLRMTLARRGLDLVTDLPVLKDELTRTPTLARKRSNLEDRYAELEEKIAKAKANPGGAQTPQRTAGSLTPVYTEHKEEEPTKGEEGI